MSQTYTAGLIEGAGLARRILDRTATRAAALRQQTDTAPCLATVLVGDDPASVTYVRMKRARCAKVGIEPRHVELPAATTTDELVGAITALSRDDAVDAAARQLDIRHRGR
jgi:methylenetetrahydrofolate dehydrogenase (NADP+)/methenyltetrahydrofolate cyclohydrolase